MITAAASSAGSPAREQTSEPPRRDPAAPPEGAGPPGHTPSSVQVTHAGEAIVIVVRDHLDGSTGAALVAAATAAVGSKDATRLDIDLRELVSFTSEGAEALVSCRSLGARLADGLHYRTGRGEGRSALLSAYRAVDTAEMEAITVREGDGTSLGS